MALRAVQLAVRTVREIRLGGVVTGQTERLVVNQIAVCLAVANATDDQDHDRHSQNDLASS